MNDRSITPRRSRLMAIALLVAVFLAGALTGAALLNVLTPRAEASAWAPPTRGPAGPVLRVQARGEPPPERMTVLLDHRLDLSEEQRLSIREILERRQAEAIQVLDEVRPRLTNHMTATNAEIREVLTPEQREEFDRFHQERRTVIRMRGGFEGPDRDGRWRRGPR